MPANNIIYLLEAIHHPFYISGRLKVPMPSVTRCFSLKFDVNTSEYFRSVRRWIAQVDERE